MATKNYELTVSSSMPVRSYTYDANGNCTGYSSSGDQGATYEWDAEDRLVAVNRVPRRHEFTYDGFGRRVKMVEKFNGTITDTKQFIWDGTQIAEERDGANNVTKRFYSQGEQIAGSSYYYTRDHLGSVREMTDAAGNVRARYEYDPYGRRTKVAGDLEATFGFTGHYYQPWTKLHLALYRAYDADLGRWLNRDPIEEAGGINLYGYVGNNPMNRIDPLGLWWWDGDYIEWGVGGLLGFHGGDVAGESWSGFGEGWSKGGQGVINDFTGGLFDEKYGLFYDSFDQLDKDAFGSGIKCDSAFKFGSNAGRVAEGALLAAGGAWAWNAAGLPTMSIGYAPTVQAPGIHFFWGVTTSEGTVVLHSLGVSTTIGASTWAGYLGGSTAITGIPILFPGAAAATGVAGYNCLTGACGALRRGLIGF